MAKPTKNLFMKPIIMTTEICNEVVTKINQDFSELDPPINYDIEIRKKNENDNRIEVKIHDQEFILSPYFTEYLVNLQMKYLWPKQIYDVVFYYEPLETT